MVCLNLTSDELARWYVYTSVDDVDELIVSGMLTISWVKAQWYTKL